MFHLFVLTVVTTSTVIAAPIYQPAFHGPLPGLEHEFHIQHIRHIDEQGTITYIHDINDHKPDFCSLPGEEELCRQQIEAANNAPTIFNDEDEMITLTEPHRDDELVPGHNAVTHETNPLDTSSSDHTSDSTITLDDGNVITIHNENGHIRNINDNIEGPPSEGGHIPNIRSEQGKNVHPEKIQDDENISDLINIQHQRNINDNPQQQQDGPAPEGGHIPNINKGQAITEQISSQTPSNTPHPGSFGPHTIASHPINKLQEAIRKTTQ